jgi:hypothetical protein
MMNTTKKIRSMKNNSRGGAAMLLTTIFFMMATLAIVTVMSIVLLSDLRLYRQLISTKRALISADAAIEEAMVRIANSRPISSTETVAYNNATGTVNIFPIAAEENGLYSTGKADQYIRKTYAHAVKATNGNFPYGAQVGRGGLRMGNNAVVDSIGLYNSNIYSGGAVIGGPGVTVNGNVTVSSSIAADPLASSTACVSDETVGRTNPNIDYAQSFSISTTSPETLYKVSLYIKRNSNPNGATVKIVADNAGAPDTTVIASEILDYTTVATTYGWIDVIFSVPPTLNPATTYWIILDATQNNAKYWTWCRSNSDTYSGGSPLYKLNWSTAGAWSSVTGDLSFRIYVGGGVSKLDRVNVTGTLKADAITNATIGTDAYYQSISGSTVGGATFAGSPTPPEIRLPLSSSTIALWKAQAASGGTINGNCGSGGVAGCNTASFTIGPKKVNGNLLLDNNQTLTLTGTLWVTGNIDIENNSEVRCHPSYGNKSCSLIADGYIDVNNNGTFSGSGSLGSFVLALTTKDGCLGTSGVGCAPGNYGITVSNNVDGALFYAADSFVGIVNNAEVTAVVGYGLELSNNGAIRYDNAVMSMVIASGATTTISGWDITQWSEFY